jgi:hypothetical protein
MKQYDHIKGCGRKYIAQLLILLKCRLRSNFTLLIASSLFLSQPLIAAQITFFGTSQNSVTTTIPWVAGSTMWGHLDAANGNGTATDGFNSLSGKDITMLAISFGNLNLTSFLSPGVSSSGFEVYTDDGAGTPFEFTYDGALWATGDVNFLRVDVANNLDLDATATMSVTLLSAGVDDLFFNEIMSLTGNSGMITLNAHSFAPINAVGLFSSVTTLEIAAVPVPAAVWLFGSGLIGLIAVAKRKKS